MVNYKQRTKLNFIQSCILYSHTYYENKIFTVKCVEWRPAMKEKAYYETINVKNEVKLRKLLEALPPFCKQFFIGIEATSSSRTKIAYAYDIGCFFDYLHTTNPICAKMNITEFPISILNEITPMDIEEYLSYLKYYEKDGTEHTNDEVGLKRKLSSLRSFYHYYYKNGLIEDDPTVKVDMPKIHEKNIIRLDVDEVAKLLDEVESGENLTAKQPFMQDSIGVTDPKKFLDSILPYMIKQKMILEERQNGKIFYKIRKD